MTTMDGRSPGRIPLAARRPVGTRASARLPAGRVPVDPTVPVRVAALQRPLASYHLVLTSSCLLLALGLVMVFSASSVRSYATYGSSYAIAMRQCLFLVIGVPCMLIGSRLPIRFWRASATVLLLISFALLVLVLVPGVGRRVDGGTRWIPLAAGLNIQPSELAKLALVLWGADLLVRKDKLLGEWKHLFIPLLPAVGGIVVLVMLEPDMGTAIVVVSITSGLLWVVGTPLRYFGGFVAVIVGLGTLLAVTEPYRLQRLTSFLHPFDDAHVTGYQAVQGLYALSSGGWFGLGLGASREKWVGGLPNAHTDFVFAIVGEELGLLGSLAVLVLFSTLIFGGVRIAKRSTDPFARLAAAAVTVWIAAQALVNIGAVVGMLPITGIPLPFLSFGGSALISLCIAIGLLLALARREPGAAQALEQRRGEGRGSAGSGLRGRLARHRTAGGPTPAPRPTAPRPTAGPASGRLARRR